MHVALYLRDILKTPIECVVYSIAQWSKHSEVAGSIPRENFLSVTRSPVLHSCEKSQHSAESRGFSPGAPVSSHREVDRVC